MKLLTRTLSLLTIASLSLFFANCGGDDGDDTPEEKTQLGKLVGTWELYSATLETDTGDPDKTDDYTGFTLELIGTFDEDSEEEYPYTYETTNRPDLSPWEESGSWGFGGDPKSDILRQDSDGNILSIQYTLSDDDKTLTLTYTFSGAGFEAKTAQVEGDWTLILTKQ